MIQPFPLQWPAGRGRIRTPEATRSAVSLASARDHLLRQMDLLGAKLVVISSNAVLRKDGLPMAKQPRISDVGVAVWFQWVNQIGSEWLCISCDLYDSIAGNIRAIGLSVSEIRASSGRLFIPLKPTVSYLFATKPPVEHNPPPKQPQPKAEPSPKPNPWPLGDWRQVLDMGGVITWTLARENYIRLAKVRHPDKGGTKEQFQQLQDAYEQAKKKFNIK